MIECIAQIEVSINQRFDHMAMLTSDTQSLVSVFKDEDKRRTLIRNFRMIKSYEKDRITHENKYIKTMQRLSKKLTKPQIIVCQTMLANCMNQYLNSDYEARKTGDWTDLVDLFEFYYSEIKAVGKANQMKVIRNCKLFEETNFMSDNLAYFLSNVQESINFVYESEKNKFFALVKTESKSISPQKTTQEEEERFDTTGKQPLKSKRQLQIYCFQLSKMLNLEHIYLNYFYFSALEIDRRKKVLLSNFIKRNIHIHKIIQQYALEYKHYSLKTTD